MTTLDRTKRYDLDEWREWLSDHGININLVNSVDLDDEEATAHLFKLNDMGHRYVVDDELALEPRTFKMKTPHPPFSDG